MGIIRKHILRTYTVHWRGNIYKFPTYEDAILSAKRLTAFEYDGVGNRAIIKSSINGEEEGIVYVVWIDNAQGFMQWVFSGTFIIEEN